MPLSYFKSYYNIFSRDAEQALMDDGSQKEVMVYIMNSQETQSFPSPEYLEIIEEGYERFGFDKKILKRALKEAEPR